MSVSNPVLIQFVTQVTNPPQTLAQVLETSGITPVEDSTHTLGLGVGADGTATTQSGIITAVQPATT